MEKQKILFLLTQDLESPSGVGRYLPISRILVKLGYSVSIAALHSNYNKLVDRKFQTEGVNVFYVSQMHIRKEENKTKYFNPTKLLWYALLGTYKLLLAVLHFRPNIIIIGKPHPMNSIAGIVGGFLKKSKTILDCDDYEVASNYFSSNWQKKIVEKFENNIPKFVDIITTNTQFNKNRIIDQGILHEKIFYLPNGIDPDRFRYFDREKTKRIQKRLGLSGKKVVAYIGSLNLANHPVDLLINAFLPVTKVIPDVVLLIVGGGKDLGILKSGVDSLGISDQVFFEGRVSPDVVPNYYELANVAVDPVYDNDAARGRCPLKMFESWIMGTPFITSDIGDRATLCGVKDACVLAKPGNAEDLANKIIDVLNDFNLAQRMRNNGLERSDLFLWDTLVKQNVKILSKWKT